jgi:hypothetical protein
MPVKELQINSAKVNTGDGDTGSTFTLPEGLHKAEFFDGVKDVDDLANKAFELGGQVYEMTKNKPVIPETADGYEVTVADGMAAGDELVKSLKAAALESGMTKAQASKWAEVYGSHISTQKGIQVEALKAAHEKAVSDTENGLKDVWKEKYGPNMDAATQVLAKFGTEDFKAELNKYGRGNSVHFAQFLLKVHGAMSESVFVEGAPAGPKKMRRTKGGKPMLDFSKSMPNQT